MLVLNVCMCLIVVRFGWIVCSVYEHLSSRITVPRIRICVVLGVRFLFDSFRIGYVQTIVRCRVWFEQDDHDFICADFKMIRLAVDDKIVGIISSLSEVQGAVCTRRKSQGPNRFITNLITNKRLFFCVNRHKPTNTPFGRKPRGTMVTFQIV